MTDTAFYKYLTPTARDKERGVYVENLGYQPDTIPSVTRYWAQSSHPRAYWFDKEHRRTLHSYQFLYNVAGTGYFESATSARETVPPGTIMCLFPGIWHDYGPLVGTGWGQYWVGINGDWVPRLFPSDVLRLECPVRHVGMRPDIIEAYRSLFEMMAGNAPVDGDLLAAAACRLVALLAHACRIPTETASPAQIRAEQIALARKIIERHVELPLDLHDVATGVNMGYSSLRTGFKRMTGFSPQSYLLSLRIERARNLLSGTHDSVKAIADRLQFSSPYYFSRFFKNRTGMSPSEWRMNSRQ